MGNTIDKISLLNNEYNIIIKKPYGITFVSPFMDFIIVISIYKSSYIYIYDINNDFNNKINITDFILKNENIDSITIEFNIDYQCYIFFRNNNKSLELDLQNYSFNFVNKKIKNNNIFRNNLDEYIIDIYMNKLVVKNTYTDFMTIPHNSNIDNAYFVNNNYILIDSFFSDSKLVFIYLDEYQIR